MIDIFYQRPTSVRSSISWSLKSFASSKDAKEIIDQYDEKGIPETLAFDKIVKGETCVPCTVNDFVNYMRYVEQDSSNLEFFLWMQDYIRRFNNLSDTEKALSPAWKATSSATLHAQSQEDIDQIIDDSSSSEIDLSDVKTMSFSQTLDIKPFSLISSQPFRSEIRHITKLYLTPTGALPLSISPTTRNLTLNALRHTTHPSAFTPIIQSIEHNLRSHAHPRFVRHSLQNANPARLNMVRIFGTVNISISLLITLLLILSHKSRWWRLWSLLPMFIGILAILNARRGLCVILLALGYKRNLMPWEVYAVDEEEAIGENHQTPTGPIFSNRLSRVDSKAFDLESKEEETRIRLFIKEYDNKPVLSRIYERRVQVEENEVRRLQMNILAQSLTIAAMVTLSLQTIFVAIPRARLY